MVSPLARFPLHEKKTGQKILPSTKSNYPPLCRKYHLNKKSFPLDQKVAPTKKTLNNFVLPSVQKIPSQQKIVPPSIETPPSTKSNSPQRFEISPPQQIITPPREFKKSPFDKNILPPPRSKKSLPQPNICFFNLFSYHAGEALSTDFFLQLRPQPDRFTTFYEKNVSKEYCLQKPRLDRQVAITQFALPG